MTEKSDTRQAGAAAQPLVLYTGIGNMPFGGQEVLTPEQAERKREALRHFQAAYEAQTVRREFDEAADLYRLSIEIYPTAEAHTFLGWTYSFMGLIDEAIEECLKAIEVDPAFGNPYNDIGAYLIEKGDLHSAIAWLERAKKAARYESYFYPYFNLGRVYEVQGRLFEALAEYAAAIELNGNYRAAIQAYRRLQGRLN
jgi:tetratricopeptide (TPR) repeat protein